jgi:threonine synthase
MGKQLTTKSNLYYYLPMIQLLCYLCNKTYPINEPVWQCLCGGFLDLKFEFSFDLKKIERGPPTMWRYRDAIPIKNESKIISFGEGFTPLLEVDVQNRTILIKQEQLFSTGSFKDRGASVLISHVKALGIQEVVEDSSGNAGSAIAAYCAKAGITCEIYVPESTSVGKLNQIKGYGAVLKKIPGSREDTAAAVLKAAEKKYYASHYWNPFFFHGTKTFAYECCQQLGWNSPDTIILPVGHGSLLLGASIGFNELTKAGIINRGPRLVGVQAENCAPLGKAFKDGLNQIPQIKKEKTLAEGIAIAQPLRGRQILDAVRNSGGLVLTVSEKEIERSRREMGAKGFYIEPTSASTVAGIKKYLQESNPSRSERIVAAFTGHGLKAGYAS